MQRIFTPKKTKNLAWFCFVFRLTFLSLAKFLIQIKIDSTDLTTKCIIYYACVVFVPIIMK
jgi:hypothetical protein